MITVTEEAKDLFMNVERPDGTVLRLDPVVDQDSGETQIGISAGEQMSGDQVVEHQGETLLYIAAPVSEALDGSTLDAVDTPQGPGIGIITPDS
jgi:iron-sulfur cluster assembly protein